MKLTNEQRILVLGVVQELLSKRYERLSYYGKLLPFANVNVVEVRTVVDVMMDSFTTELNKCIEQRQDDTINNK